MWSFFSGTLTYVLPVNVAGVVTARARTGDNITLYGIGFWDGDAGYSGRADRAAD
jgi:hypothetical protein